MGIVKAIKLVHDYYKYDESGHVEGTYRALDNVELDMRQDRLLLSWDTTAPENPRWRSISMPFCFLRRVHYC